MTLQTLIQGKAERHVILCWFAGHILFWGPILAINKPFTMIQ